MAAPFEPIPGETPLDDISGLKIPGVATRGELSFLEAENINKVILKYLSKTPSRRSARFDFSWALKLHKEMFGDVWSWAGRLRRLNLNLGKPWDQVEPQLFQLMENLAFWEKDGVDLLTQAVWLHHGAVVIHPFQNGNGRWSRMLANIWLKLHRSPLTEWPEQVIGTMSVARKDYLAALRQADEGDFAALLELHKRFTPAK